MVSHWLCHTSFYLLSPANITYGREQCKYSQNEIKTGPSDSAHTYTHTHTHTHTHYTSGFATKRNKLRNKHAHRKYCSSSLVKQTMHSSERYVSTCSKVCPRKILPPHLPSGQRNTVHNIFFPPTESKCKQKLQQLRETGNSSVILL